MVTPTFGDGTPAGLGAGTRRVSLNAMADIRYPVLAFGCNAETKDPAAKNKSRLWEPALLDSSDYNPPECSGFLPDMPPSPGPCGEKSQPFPRSPIISPQCGERFRF
jgi:hypothetical protein